MEGASTSIPTTNQHKQRSPAALETSAREGAIVLQCEGVVLGEGKGQGVVLQFDALHEGGSYVMVGGERRAVTREKLVEAAASGAFVGDRKSVV